MAAMVYEDCFLSLDEEKDAGQREFQIQQPVVRCQNKLSGSCQTFIGF